MSGRIARGWARIIRASLALDRAYRIADRLRSQAVTRFASDAVLDAYNDLAYANTSVYVAGSASFRQGFFQWEAEMIARTFPPAPGRVLVGGAGGGREALALAERGYEVVAFDASPQLARSLAAHAQKPGAVEALVGRYEQLPLLRRADGDDAVDLGARPPFDAALLGWTSYSHVRRPADRVRALAMMTRLTSGPVVASFFAEPDRPAARPRLTTRIGRRLGLGSNGDLFTPYIGFYHVSRREEIEREIRNAGAELLEASYDDADGRWPWVAIRRAAAVPPRG